MGFNLSSNLGKEIFDSLRKSPFKSFLSDYGINPKKELSRGVVLALSLLFSKQLREASKGSRVGIVLPPGLAGFVANFAVLFSGRVPVNLNFTLGHSINCEILEDAHIEFVLTASGMVKKFPDFPWPEQKLMVDEFLHMQSAQKRIVCMTLLRAWIFPDWTASDYRIPRTGGDEVSALLYTSGSSGKPKGVPLSHRNLLANCNQLYGLELFKKQPKVLLNLPLFHSFGFTVGMLFSTLRGLPLATAPSPLDHKLNLRIIAEQKVQILLGTPTFLRGYLKKSKQGQLDSVRYVVAGAEKSPQLFRERWEKEVGCQYLEGYGLTETSPALSFNLPGSGKKCGSVGRLLSGVECCTLDPESGQETPLSEGGMLCFRGPNIFAGYWNDPQRSEKVLSENGWFKTGDLGKLDDEGFLWIEGRSSRFSKIGGEMVPHARVEDEIMDFLGLCPSEEPSLVVTSLPDEQKGERLVLLSSIELDLDHIKNGLSKRGIPNLWIPRKLLPVQEIPILPTGKINWAEIKTILSQL